MKDRILAGATALLAAMNVTPAASAASIRTGRVSVSTIVEFGNTVQPVVIDENSPINFAKDIEIGGSGTVNSTIVQIGTRNYASVFQIGGTTNSQIDQSGVTNTAYVTQIGNSTNSLIAQIGNMNTGSVSQFGNTNGSEIFQFGR